MADPIPPPSALELAKVLEEISEFRHELNNVFSMLDGKALVLERERPDLAESSSWIGLRDAIRKCISLSRSIAHLRKGPQT